MLELVASFVGFRVDIEEQGISLLFSFEFSDEWVCKSGVFKNI